MSQKFNHWKKLHDNNNLFDFNFNQEALLWLKIKSITRRGIIEDFAQNNAYSLKEKSLTKQFEELFNLMLPNLTKSHQKLDKYIVQKNAIGLKQLDIKSLVDELYKIEVFDWGGDYQNSLDKYLVSKFVKSNNSYDWLERQLNQSIAQAVQGYVFNSWYNHWSSILIEHIFKSHKIVLPTIGQIKNVDFFINDIPFDLKVTYLPVNFIEKQRKLAGLKPELTFLKQRARKLNISFKTDDKNLYYQLTEKMKDKADKLSLQTLKEIKDFRLDLITKVKVNPHLLAQNLYEEQGEMRFGAENRIFLVLVDTDNFEDSWKLKRNMDLLKPNIHTYLDDFHQNKLSNLEISFYKKGNPQQFPQQYKALTDVLLIEKT